MCKQIHHRHYTNLEDDWTEVSLAVAVQTPMLPPASAPRPTAIRGDSFWDHYDVKEECMVYEIFMPFDILESIVEWPFKAIYSLASKACNFMRIKPW
jgi:hypothetical protein